MLSAHKFILSPLNATRSNPSAGGVSCQRRSEATVGNKATLQHAHNPRPLQLGIIEGRYDGRFCPSPCSGSEVCSVRRHGSVTFFQSA